MFLAMNFATITSETFTDVCGNTPVIVFSLTPPALNVLIQDVSSEVITSVSTPVVFRVYTCAFRPHSSLIPYSLTQV